MLLTAYLIPLNSKASESTHPGEPVGETLSLILFILLVSFLVFLFISHHISKYKERKLKVEVNSILKPGDKVKVHDMHKGYIIGYSELLDLYKVKLENVIIEVPSNSLKRV